MDKNAIKKYAVWARRELITRVAGRAAKYGITENNCKNIHADSVDGRVLSSTEKEQRKAFIEKVHAEGYEQALEEVAYTWFNRFCALRYMEVNGYLPTHIRVFTNEEGKFKPHILDEAIHLELTGLDMEKVFSLKGDNETEELYRYLLITQCNALGWILPGMFQKIADYTELLLPDNLLREGSVIERMIAEIPEEDWTDQVQIIGWLYQYYNAEKKDEVFAALKKNIKITKENIPAATQLFTPDWIVRYMVENSLGRLWVEGHPNEELQSGWKYYLEVAEQEPEAEAKLVEIRKEYAILKPEDIKCIDPCCGSGHILVYMFDVLMQIYESYGYTTQEAVTSIIENNLYGLDIDDRAAQLAYFAVAMKARSYDRRFFSRDIQPRVYAIRESAPIDKDLLSLFGPYSDVVKKLVDTFADAKEYGGLIEPDISMKELLVLEKHMVEMDEMSEYGSLNSELFTYMALKDIWPLLEIAKLLVQKYDVVVTNPPYMGASNMNTELNNFIKQNFADYKSDFFSSFIVRCKDIATKDGYLGFFSPYVWMFLQSYEKLRTLLCSKAAIETLIQFEYSAFEEATVPVCTFAFKNSYVKGKKGCYLRLTDFRGGMEIQRQKTLEAISNHNCGYYFEKSSDNFSKIPGSPIAYWLSDVFFNAFKNPKIGDIAYSKQGLATADNNRFLREWYEVDIKNIKFDAASHEDAMKSRKKWFPYNKGGDFRRWYGNNDYVVNWENNGYAIKHFKDENGKLRSRPQNLDFMFKSSVSWSDITSSANAFRYKPVGHLFDITGMSLFSNDNLFYLLGLCNSKIVNKILEVVAPTLHCQCGDVANIPVIIDPAYRDVVEKIVESNIGISKMDWDSFETSWDFMHHTLVYPVSSIALAYNRWEEECNARFNQLKSNEEELNRIFINVYGLRNELTPEVEDKDVTVRVSDLRRDIKSLISYAVGCMFGRYSLDVDGLVYAGGNWDASLYQTYQPDYNGILPICDDEYFTDDIVGYFIDFIKTVYSEDTLEENLQFIADALGGSGSSREIIRKYFLNNFYTDHCKIYQKRPIYWLFDSGKKNGFKCLIYLHRYQPDTIARIRTDYVHEQQARYRTAIAERQSQINEASASERIKLSRNLKKLQDQSNELLVYEERIHHLADQFIDIDLDDGVKVNYAKFQDVLAKIK